MRAVRERRSTWSEDIGSWRGVEREPEPSCAESLRSRSRRGWEKRRCILWAGCEYCPLSNIEWKQQTMPICIVHPVFLNFANVLLAHIFRIDQCDYHRLRSSWGDSDRRVGEQS